jgi:chromosome partitioning protein
MDINRHRCSICQTEFEVHFSYQLEQTSDPDGEPVTRYFCTQRCLVQSHADAHGHSSCDACGKTFRVELASQVIFTGGRRHYACAGPCRRQILGEQRHLALCSATPDAAGAAGPATEPAPRPVATPHVIEAGVSTVREALPTIRTEARPSTVLPPPSPALPPRPAHLGPQVLAVFNHKGGTGKTTTAITVAAGLAARGKRVLLVDTDGQGNVGMSLGLSSERSLYHVLVMGLSVEQAVTPFRDGLDVLASNETLAAAELYLAGRRKRDTILSERLMRARELYDHVIVDCSPSLSLLNQNALVFADSVLCPVACDYLSLVGVRQVLRTLKNVNKLLSHPVRLWGVLPTLFDARARICHEALGTLREHFGSRCLDPIRQAIKVKEAPACGKTLFEYAPGSSAAEDYGKVVDRLLSADDRAWADSPKAAGGMR